MSETETATGSWFRARMRDAGLPEYAHPDDIPGWVTAVWYVYLGSAEASRVLAAVVARGMQEEVEAAFQLGGREAVSGVLASLAGSGSCRPGG